MLTDRPPDATDSAGEGHTAGWFSLHYCSSFVVCPSVVCHCILFVCFTCSSMLMSRGWGSGWGWWARGGRGCMCGCVLVFVGISLLSYLCVCVCVCVCVHACGRRVCEHVCTSSHISTYVCVCVCVLVCIHLSFSLLKGTCSIKQVDMLDPEYFEFLTFPVVCQSYSSPSPNYLFR